MQRRGMKFPSLDSLGSLEWIYAYVNIIELANHEGIHFESPPPTTSPATLPRIVPPCWGNPGSAPGSDYVTTVITHFIKFYLLCQQNNS